MPSARIVPRFDEIENGHACLGLIPEALSFDQLGLEGGEEALAHRVVVGVTDRAHRKTDACLFAPQAEGDRGVLSTLIATMG